MRKLAIALATTAAVVATPAMARDGAWYVGGDFGAMIVDDTDFDIGANEDVLTINHEYGYDGGLFVGYDLGGFRLEAEVAYKKADLESFENTLVLPALGGSHPVGVHDFGAGSTTALSFMVNGMLDFGDDDGISGFVGAGAGYGKVKYNELRAFENSGQFLDDSDSNFAWQVFAGVRQAVSDNVDVTVKYRFFNVPGIHAESIGGFETDSSFRSHSLLGGITFNFGQPEPPPPVQTVAPAPPPTPAPPPVQMQTCPNQQRIPVNQVCPAPPVQPVPRSGERG